MDNRKIRVAFHTLGCKLNFAETSTISRSFPAEKFQKVPASQEADVYIINTCSVTDAADKKCRQAIKKFVHRSPGAFIAVVGCYAQLKPQDIASIEGVDLILGANEKFDLPGYLKGLEKKKSPEIHSCELSSSDKFSYSHSIGDRTRSFLKVQDGCDYGCSYCTIPKARGKSRNPDIESLLKEAREIAAGGVKEIVLTGVNIGDFGKSTGDTFAGLLRKLIYIEGIDRLRISSIEPNLLTDEIIEMVSDGSKIVPHFHIPLQSGSNKILGLMRRRYTREIFADRVAKISVVLPLAGIGADVIAGFPGETEADFEDTCSFLAGLPLSYLHVFTFSERPGTAAEKFEAKLSFSEKEMRSKQLKILSENKSRDFMTKNIGKEAEVLFEKTKSNGQITGFTGNYLKVEHPWDTGLSGKIKRVLIRGLAPSGNINIDLIDN